MDNYSKYPSLNNRLSHRYLSGSENPGAKHVCTSQRHRKWLWEAMEGVGGVWEKRWWWWLVRPFDNASGMGGFEPKSRNGAAGARLRARRRKRLREAMEGVGGVWGKRWWWWLVRPFDNASGGGVGSQKKTKTSLWGLVLGWIWVGDGAAASYGAKQPPTIIS